MNSMRVMPNDQAEEIIIRCFPICRRQLDGVDLSLLSRPDEARLGGCDAEYLYRGKTSGWLWRSRKSNQS